MKLARMTNVYVDRNMGVCLCVRVCVCMCVCATRATDAEHVGEVHLDDGEGLPEHVGAGVHRVCQDEAAQLQLIAPAAEPHCVRDGEATVRVCASVCVCVCVWKRGRECVCVCVCVCVCLCFV